MKEDEATQDKICPLFAMMLVGKHQEVPHDWFDGCYGSDCMMWRWDKINDFISEKTGYCGLGGKE